MDDQSGGGLSTSTIWCEEGATDVGNSRETPAQLAGQTIREHSAVGKPSGIDLRRINLEAGVNLVDQLINKRDIVDGRARRNATAGPGVPGQLSRLISCLSAVRVHDDKTIPLSESDHPGQVRKARGITASAVKHDEQR
jgi:hypothetical protein